MDSPQIIFVPRAISTNSLLARMDADSPLPAGTVLAAHTQIAGRGQRGNTWESSPGQNLTFSMLLRPAIHPSRQFAVSEAVALAVADTLRTLVPEGIAVKWPNDIYYHNGKIAGILIENTVTGATINRSIAGIGVNINQTRFTSPAPNPVSLSSITGSVHSLPPLLREIADAVARNMTLLDNPLLHERYLASLWRRSGWHDYAVPATGEIIRAAIHDVLPSGHIVLLTADNRLHTFAFKEVSPLL